MINVYVSERNKQTLSCYGCKTLIIMSAKKFNFKVAVLNVYNSIIVVY